METFGNDQLILLEVFMYIYEHIFEFWDCCDGARFFSLVSCFTYRNEIHMCRVLSFTDIPVFRGRTMYITLF